MRANLFIKYIGPNENNSSEIELRSLGESIMGFDEVIKEIIKISKINADIKVKTNSISDGSVLVETIIQIVLHGQTIPFSNVPDLLDFLKVSDLIAWKAAQTFFSTHREINDYFSRNPFDQDLLLILIGYLLRMLKEAPKNKRSPSFDELPKEYAKGLHKLVKTGKFKKTLSPFVENEMKEIQVSEKRDFSGKVIINRSNFENYLSEKEMILPEYENGKLYVFTGTIVGMQCSRGDSMQIRVHGFQKKNRDLTALPSVGKTTKDYDEFYGRIVTLKAYIDRNSLYEKPKLLVQDMRLQQSPLIED